MNAPISAGDLAPPSSGFEALYRDNYAFVWRCARRMCVDEGELEDVIQDVFVIAYRRLDSLVPGVAPSTWLFGIMRNVVRNRARGRGRQQRRVGALARDVDASERHRRRIETELAERVLAGEMLLGFLRELDDSQRDVFVLAELEGHSAKEIATALAINPNTASSRLRLARRAFCAHFGLEPSRQGAHEVTRALREQPEQPDASVQNRSWGLLLAAVAKPGGLTGGGLMASGLLTVATGKLTTMLGAVSIVSVAAATLTVLVIAQGEPRDVSAQPAPRPLRSSSAATLQSSSSIELRTSGEDDEESDPPVVVQAAPRRPHTAPLLPAEPGEQLRLAREALIAGNAAHTLELLDAIDDDDTRLLGQRVATEVAALCKLGEIERARQAVELLRASDPTAPVLAQLDDACW